MEFKVLSSGDLYAYERSKAETAFYWLCELCASRYDLQVDRCGRVIIRTRNGIQHNLPPAGGSLRLVTRSARSAPRLQTTPSGESPSSSGLGGDYFFPDFWIRGAIHL
jgi:hypothetical protein